MPYVPEEVKERLKREVSIQRLAEARGIKLRRVGKELAKLRTGEDEPAPERVRESIRDVIFFPHLKPAQK